MPKINMLPGKGWTLFLDRDGVINQRLEGDYVKTPEGFLFIDGVLESIAYFSNLFGRIIVVTNQQGVGKGLMSVSELELIHRKMLNEIAAADGRIDKVYFCPDLEYSGSFNRKPMIGMGLKAKRDFPDIDFHKSVMAGDTLSDMRFGTRLKMKTVLISDDLSLTRANGRYINYRYSSLRAFAEALGLR